jgi:hypothetical protein
MEKHDATAIIMVKSKPGKEASLEKDLVRMFARRKADCKKCYYKGDGRVCLKLGFRTLGHALGRFDFALIAEGSHARDVHGLVLHCIRENLKPRVLDTETSFVYNLPGVGFVERKDA